MIELALVVLAASFALVMPVASWSCSLIGGWAALAREFGQGTLSSETCVRRKDFMLGWMNYSGCVTYCAGPEGLRLTMLWLFRLGHPPVLIPWAAIEQLEPPRGWGPFRSARLTILGSSRRWIARIPPSVFELVHRHAAAELQRASTPAP